MTKPKLATCSLAGCFGCHTSFLDIDERLVDLVDLVDFDKSPLDDKKKFDCMVDIGLIEGGCSSDYNVEVLRDFRKHCRVLIGVGACSLTGGVPSMRNMVPLSECLAQTYLHCPTVVDGQIPDDEDLPKLLDKVYPSHQVVKIDYFLPGCPPSADAIWAVVSALLTGQEPKLSYQLLKYD